MDEETEDISVKMPMNFMNHTAFLLSFNNVNMLLEEPDSCPLAFHALKSGIITEEEVDDLMAKVEPCYDGDLIFSFDELISLYTIVELSAKYMLSDKGDEFLKKVETLHADDAKQNTWTADGYKGLLNMSSAFVKRCTENLAEFEIFRARKEELDKLNEWI